MVRFDKKRFLRALMVLGAMLVMGVVFLGVGYRRDRARLTHEWHVKVESRPRSTPAQIRGALESLIDYGERSARRDGGPELDPPATIPLSMWDNSACAAAVVSMVNFIAGGEPVLRSSDAWTFASTNVDRVEVVYDRLARFPNDFARDGDRIVERHEPGRLWLSRFGSMLVGRGDSLTVNGVYVVGYHYHETQSDRAILAANGTWNSHLLLLLGRRGGSWWGYHLFHDPRRPEQNPFHIDDLGEELPPQFDLMYIWRVKGIELGLEAQPVTIASMTRPYHSIVPMVGWMNRLRSDRLASFVDSGIMGWLGNVEQYPRMLIGDGYHDLANSPNASSRWWGQTAGYLNGEPIRRQDGGVQRSAYGQEFQCVEFVNRYYARVLGHRNMSRTGNADSYFYDPGNKGLVAFRNGSDMPPRRDDIIVFDPDGLGGDPGHVGIIYDVSDTRVCFAQQNTRQPSACLPVRVRDGRWNIDPLASDRPCVGWSRMGGVR